MKNPRYKEQLEEMAEGWDRLANKRRQGIIKNKTKEACSKCYIKEAAKPPTGDDRDGFVPVSCAPRQR